MADITVTVGDTVDVDFDVLNRGDVTDTQDIELRQDGSVVDTSPGVELVPAGSYSGTLEWDTSGVSAGTYTLAARSDDDTATRSVEVQSAGGGGGTYIQIGWFSGSAQNDTAQYSSSSDAWDETLPDPPAGGQYRSTTNYGGVVFAGPGSGDSFAAHRYDVSSGQYIATTDYPDPQGVQDRTGANCPVASDGSVVYCSTTGTNLFHEYDPATNSYATLASQAMGGQYGKMYHLNGDLYLMASSDGTDRVDKYDIQADSWTANYDTLPQNRRQCAAAIYDGEVYMFGGEGDASSAIAYDPVDKSTRTLTNMPQPVRFTMGMDVSSGGVIHVAGFYSNGSASDTHFTYDTSTDTYDTSVADLPSARFATNLCLISP